MIELEAVPSELADGLELRFNEPLSAHTSLGVGGPADIFAVPHSIEALAWTIRYASERHIPFFVLGEGTNIVVRDGGIRGMVIHIGCNLAEVSRTENTVTAQAGARVAMVCRRCCEWGLSGLEFAAGIPGSIGGALVMNAGAFGGDMADVVAWVLAIDHEGRERRLLPGELDLGYRHSVFMGNGLVIAEAGFTLAPGECRGVRELVYETIEKRCSGQPVAQRSAGSVFKRPEGDYAGRLLEEAGAKGLRVGGAKISEKHANFIVNCAGATAAEVLALIDLVRERVHETSGVWLESEVLVVGEDPE